MEQGHFVARNLLLLLLVDDALLDDERAALSGAVPRSLRPTAVHFNRLAHGQAAFYDLPVAFDQVLLDLGDAIVCSERELALSALN